MAASAAAHVLMLTGLGGHESVATPKAGRQVPVMSVVAAAAAGPGPRGLAEAAPAPTLPAADRDQPAAASAVAGPSAAIAPDRPALPLTTPDLEWLADWPAPVRPIRLRLSIDAAGQVQQVQILDCDERDQALATRLAAILQVTPHVPARLAGRDVASVKDIELAPGR